VLDDADLVVVVATADPIGLQRVVRGLGDLAEAATVSDHVLVLNRVRRAVAGRSGSELDAAVRRFTGLDPLAHLPYDRQWLDAALSSGRTLAEVRRSSPLRREVAGLAKGVLDRLSEPKESSPA
jgi:Flp pilus assembly CpaE family ATPase